jgi:hypothetical protein
VRYCAILGAPSAKLWPCCRSVCCPGLLVTAVDLPALLVLTALPHRIAVVASCAGVGFASLPTVSMVSGHRVWMRQMWTVVRSPVGAPCAELVVYAACTASVRLAPVLRRVCVGRHLLARLAHVAGYAPHAVLADHAALVQTASQTCAWHRGFVRRPLAVTVSVTVMRRGLTVGTLTSGAQAAVLGCPVRQMQVAVVGCARQTAAALPTRV